MTTTATNPEADTATRVPPRRDEYVRDTVASRNFGVVEKPLTRWERLYNQGWLRKTFIIVFIAVAWEIYARILGNDLLVPTLSATLEALWGGLAGGEILNKAFNSVRLLLQGYVAGLFLAMVFTALAMMSRLGNDLLHEGETETGPFHFASMPSSTKGQ